MDLEMKAVDTLAPEALGTSLGDISPAGRSAKAAVPDFVPGLLALISAAPLAWAIHVIVSAASAERGVLLVAALFLAVLPVPPLAYVLYRRRTVEIGELSLISLASACVLLVSVYLFWMGPGVVFPADILIWSESDFVNDIVKFRAGYPIYTAQANNESFTYPPGTQLLTYFLASLAGKGLSIPVYRMIQVGFTLLAALVAFYCCRKLVDLSLPGRPRQNSKLWHVFLLPFLFLVATNSVANLFVHNLHGDALAQLISVIAYWILLKYVETRNRRLLLLMMAVPVVGFLVKQTLAIWLVLYGIQLAVFDRPRSLKRVIVFGLAGASGIAAVIAGGCLLWGRPFLYWVVAVLGKHGMSPLRSIQHLLDVWPYLAIGLAGGFVLLRGRSFRRLLGPWVIWVILILSEIQSSAIAWMLNHIGPGSLIAGIWFAAGLARLWPSLFPAGPAKRRSHTWLRAGAVVAGLALLFNGLGLVRIPTQGVPQDAHRYVNAIEAQFEGLPARDVLLDLGTWVYLKHGVVMTDRAAPIGERGFSQTGDFSGMIQRLRQKRYAKILVRNLHTPDFWYDHFLWPRSSEIRRTLLENYHEVDRIAAVSWKADPGYLFGEISVLAPNAN